MKKSAAKNALLLQSVRLSNFLSFGQESLALPLERLNVLIGPNGSGKSNFLEAIALLRSVPRDWRQVIQRGGGVVEWIWKGAPDEPAEVEAVLSSPNGKAGLHHLLAFRREEQVVRLHDECIDNGSSKSKVKYYYRFRHGRPVIKRLGGERGKMVRPKIDLDLSILAQRRDPDSFPELAHIADVYAGIRLFREWAIGRKNSLRRPQAADERSDRLEEDLSNLWLFLNHLRRKSKVKETLLSRLRDLYEGLTDFDMSVVGGTVQVFFAEGDFSIPATRLSDGSLRYLALLAILCDPEPPPLIAIEEPELGLHPDLLPNVADLLIEASQRTQLIVTTHSDILVGALTEHPSAIVVCEKHDGQTTMKRLDPAELAVWLKKYRLGELWTRGQLGGNRW